LYSGGSCCIFGRSCVPFSVRRILKYSLSSTHSYLLYIIFTLHFYNSQITHQRNTLFSLNISQRNAPSLLIFNSRYITFPDICFDQPFTIIRGYKLHIKGLPKHMSGKVIYLLLKFNNEGAFRWLIFSEFRMHGEGHIKHNFHSIFFILQPLHMFTSPLIMTL
jgi:hypothetical protein